MGHRTPNDALWHAARVSQGRVADYKPFTMVDGRGVRCALYVSGCLFACDGCFNKSAQSFRYGSEYTDELEDQILRDLSHESVDGLSLLGGEPFLNTQVCTRLARRVREELPGKTIWAWSGYTFEQLAGGATDKRALLELVDVLVDGPYDAARRDLTLAFRGSSNQRVVDVTKSLRGGTAIAVR